MFKENKFKQKQELIRAWANKMVVKQINVKSKYIGGVQAGIQLSYNLWNLCSLTMTSIRLELKSNSLVWSTHIKMFQISFNPNSFTIQYGYKNKNKWKFPLGILRCHSRNLIQLKEDEASLHSKCRTAFGCMCSSFFPTRWIKSNTFTSLIFHSPVYKMK
jgi:hypothetical protein